MGEVGELGATVEDRRRDRRAVRRRAPRRWGRALAVLAVLAALGAGAWAVASRPGGPLDRRPDEEAPEETQARLAEQFPPVVDAPVADGSWTAAPAAPLPARSSGTATWTGRELVVWGGAADDGAGTTTHLADGAALDPAAGTWRALPAAPLSPRQAHVAVWTGDDLLVWGGEGPDELLADGAAWNPATGRWRALPPAPLAPRADAAAAWTGTELLVAGGRGPDAPLADAAALDPATGRWRPVAPLPAEVVAPDPAALALAPGTAGGQGAGAVVVWRAGRGGGGAAAAAWDPAGDAWTPLPVPAEGDDGLPILVAGRGGRLHGLRTTADGTESVAVTLAPGAGAWTAGERLAPLTDPWASSGTALGDGLVVVPLTGAGAAWDAATGAWARLPEPPPLPGGEVTATAADGGVLVWAASPPGAAPPPPAALRYQPG